MRQVPEKPTFGIIGRGKMAQHFAHYCRLSNIPYRQLSARACVAKPNLLAQIASCQTICLLIKDSEIAQFYETHIQPLNIQTVHFSGALTIPNCYGLHPLGVFSNTLYSLLDYQKIPFVIESDAPPFGTLLPGLSNQYFRLPKHLKAYYHSLCVLANNFTGYLWQKYMQEMQRIGLERALLQPFMQQSFHNLLQHPEDEVTGPLGRGDGQTILANLKALENDPYQAVYQAFVHIVHPTGVPS